MRQTQLPHGTVDIPALPASILQGAGKMFADAAASHTLFGHQNDGIGRKVMDQFFLKREDAHQLINIAGNALFGQHLCRCKNIFYLVGVAHQCGFCTRCENEFIVLLAGTAVFCQSFALSAAGVTDGPGTLHLMAQQDGKPVPQFFVV